MAEIINIKTAKKEEQAIATNDILLDENVTSAIQNWLLGINSPNILELWKPTSKVSCCKPTKKSYAEISLGKDVLKKYGYNIPWQLVQAPCSLNGKHSDNYYETVCNLPVARKLMIVLGSAYFFKMPVSRGLLSMLYNTPETKRSEDFLINRALKQLIHIGAIIETDWEMEQPVQPVGIFFSKQDDYILMPAKEYLHRFIEVIVWSVRFAAKNYNDIENAMQNYTNVSWKSAQPTPHILNDYVFVREGNE